MKILVTGAKGFLGKNLCALLKAQKKHELFEFDLDTEKSLLSTYAKNCRFIFHLAGVNRPKKQEEFMEGNFAFTQELLKLLEKHGNTPPVVLSSSVQAELDNPYGKSKKAGEELFKDYPGEAYIYRLANLFGKWSRPGYNSVTATFCYNISRDLEVKVNDPETVLELCYVDDVMDEFMKALGGNPYREGNYCKVLKTHKVKLGELEKILRSFKLSRQNLCVPDMSDELTKKLYSTYLSFLPDDGFSFPLKTNSDERGSFTEFLRTPDRGQVSVNIQKPGVTKGNHYHHTKTENFLVVKGIALIKLRNVNSKKIVEYNVSGDKLEVVQIPPGYTHNITNISDEDLATVMWANEEFNPEKPDTYDMEL
jgi:UDP-2-acetamido-2,6-beta-L-arabino-hexul-4-ose reductase